MKLNKMSKDEIENRIMVKSKELREMVAWIGEWEDFDQKSLLYEQIIRTGFELRRLIKRLKKINISLCREQIANIKAN